MSSTTKKLPQKALYPLHNPLAPAALRPSGEGEQRMYERHFGFMTNPFLLVPDPMFLYPSRQHAMAETILEYGLESQASFCLLTGEIGSGKSLLVSRLLRKLGDGVVVGLINHTHTRFRSIHGWVASALGIQARNESEIAIHEALIDAFVREYSKGRRTLLVIDEAQNLSVELLEELRLLSNVNSEKDLLLQILLVGQPELRRKLGRAELEQFAQRVSVHFHLTALENRDTHAYIRHRLKVAGGDPELFLPEAMDLVHARARGVPRLINQLCDYALTHAYADGRTRIDADLINLALRDPRSGFALPAFSIVDPVAPVPAPATPVPIPPTPPAPAALVAAARAFAPEEPAPPRTTPAPTTAPAVFPAPTAAVPVVVRRPVPMTLVPAPAASPPPPAPTPVMRPTVEPFEALVAPADDADHSDAWDVATERVWPGATATEKPAAKATTHTLPDAFDAEDLTLEVPARKPDQPHVWTHDREAIASAGRDFGRRRRLRYTIAVAVPLATALIAAGVAWWQLHPSRPAPAVPPVASAPAELATTPPRPVPAEPAAPATPAAQAPRSTTGADAATQRLANQVRERLAAGDIAGAEQLLSQANANDVTNDDLSGLRAATQAQRQRLIAIAGQVNAAVVAGALIDPATDNASTRLRGMLSVSRTDPMTLRAQYELQTALLQRGQEAAHRDQFEAAQRFLTAAANVGASPAVVSAQQQLRDEMSSAQETPVGKTSQNAQALAAPPAAPPAAPAATAAPVAMVAAVASASGAETPAATSTTAASVAASGAPPAATAADEPTPPPKADEPKYFAARATSPLDVEYPSEAQGNIEGYVTLEFTIRSDGRAADVAVVDAKPRGVFDRAALEAVRHGHFDTRALADHPSERARLKLTFKPG
jgi:TonB family protein